MSQIYDPWCCPREKTLLSNGDFEQGNVGFTSQYTYNPAITAGATLPGQYNIVTAASALAISPLWVATDHYICKGGSGKSKFMVVNGRTCQSGSKVIWTETVAVTGGKEYRFCANVKNFKQYTFDIMPKLEVKFSQPSNYIGPTPVNTTNSPCDWQLIWCSVCPTGNSLTIEIWLDETGLGDGNDLALDDISLQMKSAINPNYVLVDIATHNTVAGEYNVSANPINLPAGYGYYWEVCELDPITQAVQNTVQNVSPWWTFPAPCDFKGYDGHGGLSGILPGVFFTASLYRITFGAWWDCVAWSQSSWLLKYNVALKKAEVSKVQQSGQGQNPLVGAAGKVVTPKVEPR